MNDVPQQPDYSTSKSRQWFYTLRSRPFLLLLRRFLSGTNPTCADLGAADGSFGGALLRANLIKSYVGYELSERLQEIGRSRGIDMRPYDANVDRLSSTYDLILCTHLIEHVSSPEFLLSTVKMSLSKDGIAIIAAPNKGSICERLMGGKWVGYDDPTHINLRSHLEYEELLRGSGLKIEFSGSSYLSDLPPWGAAAALLSKFLFFSIGYWPWTKGNSSVFVVSASV